MTTLVTGGLGFVGSHFVWAAHETGRRVVVLDDRSAGTTPLLPAGVEVVTACIGDASIADLLKRQGVQEIVHFAGKIQVGESVKKPHLYFDVNFVRALRLLEAARDSKVERFVFSSTAAVYGEPETVPIPESSTKVPVNPYGASKLAFEYALQGYETAHGIRYCAPRYFNAAGAHPNGKLVEAHDPETHLLPLVLDAALGRRGPLTVFGTDYPTPDGTCVRDYIHVSDLADAHLGALDALARGERLGAMNLGTGIGQSVKAVLDAAREVTGRDVPHTVGARREGDPSQLVADPRRAGELVGFAPKRSDLRTILEDALRPRVG